MEHEDYVRSFLLGATPSDLMKLREMISELKDETYDKILHSLNKVIHTQ